MLSDKTTFFLRILTFLLTVSLCFSETAIAQSDQPRFIRLLEPAVPLAADEGTETAQNLGQILPAQDFIVYGRAKTNADAGITVNVDYRPILYAREPEQNQNQEPNLKRMPDLETFFEFGGTLELLTTDTTRKKYDIIMSELMWGIDTGLRDTTVSITIDVIDENDNLVQEDVYVPQLLSQETQWVELYNTTSTEIETDLYLLFSPFENHPQREMIQLPLNGTPTEFVVLDALSNLLFGRWELPGKSGRRPTTSFVSAYRVIDYGIVEDPSLSRDEQLEGIPFGSYNDSWEDTPDEGRRNTEFSITNGSQVVKLPYIATPGTKHVGSIFTTRLRGTSVDADQIVINEVRNDSSGDNVDWIELKNISTRTVDLEEWELSIVTGVGEDIDLVDLPPYTMERNEILVIYNQYPDFTDLMGGIDIEVAEDRRFSTGAVHRYFVSEDLDIPNNKKFVLLLRSENDQNGKDEAIEDYAGNGFFLDTSANFNTQFWPRIAQRLPTQVEDFGRNTFAARDQAWARIRYEEDDGHHADAWEKVGTQGGIGYAPDANIATSPGTPGYENDALKTTTREYNDGEISISEIMYDAGPRGNQAQWVELYNSSMTQAINLKGWELEIRNEEVNRGEYVDAIFTFKDAIILPNQTLLIVSDRATNNISNNRVYDLYRLHRNDLGLEHQKSRLLSPNAFYIKLVDTGSPSRRNDDVTVDEVGNLERERNKWIKKWELPAVDPEQRSSIGRRSGMDDGTLESTWRRFGPKDIYITYYGNRDDFGTPGYRMGSPLPVSLSSFRPELTTSSTIVIRWVTESELNNAGFNILRGEHRAGPFAIVNPTLIRGAGTTAEKHSYSFADTTAKQDVTYYYQIQEVSFDGEQRTLATRRLRGYVSPSDKFTTTWGDLKAPK